MCDCGEKIFISIGLADECVIPSGVLRGEVIVVVDASATEGVRYHRIRLELTGREHNSVRDDQGEFDALLDGYTSDRTYLSRHVTLSGKKKASEDVETALQRKQEVMYQQHHTAPYSRVVPVKPKEPKSSGGEKKKKADPTPPPATQQPHPYSEPAAVHGAEDVEMQHAGCGSNRAWQDSLQLGREGGDFGDREGDAKKIESDYQSNGSGNGEKGGDTDGKGGANGDGNRIDPTGVGIVLPDIVLLTAAGEHVSPDNAPFSGDGTGAGKDTEPPFFLSAPAPSPPTSQPQATQAPTVAALQRLQAEEERPVDEKRARRRKAKDMRLMPGRYAFPFSFRVPPWLPPSLYYSIEDSSGCITYSAKATVEFGTRRRDLTAHKHFYVLSAISRRQLVACHEEAINAATTDPLPPLSALFQVFACNCLGNLCCLARHSAVEVEVALQCSRALVLADATATFQVFRDYQAARDEAEEAAVSKSGLDEVRRTSVPVTSGGNLAGAFSGYDAFMERTYRAPEEEFTSPAAFVHKFLEAQLQRERDDGLTATVTTGSSRSSADRSERVDGGNDSGNGEGEARELNSRSHFARLAAYREAKKEAMRQQRAEVEKALPLPIGVMPLLVRVHNGCVRREIPKVRVELRENIQVFKSLEMPRVFKHPLARYEYTVSIPPGEEVTFSARLQLPKQFRRRKEDDPKLCPPPGVKTANITTSIQIVVSFPGLATYVEEEDWVNSVVQLAEAVDMSDEVLDLPVHYS